MDHPVASKWDHPVCRASGLDQLPYRSSEIVVRSNNPTWATFQGEWLREALNWEFAARDLRSCALIEAVGSDDRASQAPARRDPA
jgi:hypothetical protein